MAQRRSGLDLLDEPFGIEHRAPRPARGGHFHRDLVIVLPVLGQVDGGHAALAELALHGIGRRGRW